MLALPMMINVHMLSDNCCLDPCSLVLIRAHCCAHWCSLVIVGAHRHSLLPIGVLINACNCCQDQCKDSHTRTMGLVPVGAHWCAHWRARRCSLPLTDAAWTNAGTATRAQGRCICCGSLLQGALPPVPRVSHPSSGRRSAPSSRHRCAALGGAFAHEGHVLAEISSTQFSQVQVRDPGWCSLPWVMCALAYFCPLHHSCVFLCPPLDHGHCACLHAHGNPHHACMHAHGNPHLACMHMVTPIRSVHCTEGDRSMRYAFLNHC